MDDANKEFNIRMSEASNPALNQDSKLAIASVVFGIASLLFSCLAGLPGLIMGTIALINVLKNGGTLRGRNLAITGMVLSVVCSCISMATSSLIMSNVRERARDRLSSNSMRQMVIASQNYENAHQYFPSDIGLKNEKPNLSWRVAILPYVEQGALYGEFNINEPWDSAHNIKLVDRMPDIFKRVGWDIEPGKTVYQHPVNNGAMFATPQESNNYVQYRVNPRSVLDGLANTIMLVETKPENAVTWTKPADFEFSPKSPFTGLGVSKLGWTTITSADGVSWQFKPGDVTDEQLRSFFTANSGKPNKLREVMESIRAK